MNTSTSNFLRPFGFALFLLIAFASLSFQLGSAAAATNIDPEIQGQFAISQTCTFPVTVTDETGLNDAINCFNAVSVGGSYLISLTQSFTLSEPTNEITNTVAGTELVIEGNDFVVDGQSINGLRPFSIATDTSVAMNKVHIERGNSTANGGGIFVDGNLVFTDGSISNSQAAFDGGGIYVGSNAVVTISGSLFQGNSAVFGGGGILNGGILTTTNTTVSGNSANSGGGIQNQFGTLVLNNSTISENSGDGFFQNAGFVTVTNSIIANQTAGSDCITVSGTANGHNLDSDNSCGLSAPNDVPNSNPNLGLLQDNDSNTFTYALLAGSPAIDAADNGTCESSDQRGISRPQNTTCDIGAFERLHCLAGSYLANPGDTTCTQAETGYAVPLDGATEQTACTPGFYQDQTGQASCIPAPIGTFVPGSAATSTVDCSPGRYQDETGQSSCKDAPAGTFVDGTAAPAPTDCLGGSFQALAGQTGCDTAPAGTFATGPAATEAVDCSPGFYQPLTGQASCDAAPLGTFVAGFAAISTSDCVPGRYQDETGQSSCKDAPAGTFVDGTAAPAPTDCPAGSFQALAGQTSCDTAPAGTFAAGPAATEAVDCSLGFYQPLTGQASCDAAPLGTFVAGFAAISTSDCVPGRYQDETGQSSCKDAPAGTFVDSTAAPAPTDCPAGSFQALAGQTSCDTAPAGTFAAGPAATEAVDCSPGFFQPLTGQASCNAAPVGTFVAGFAAISTSDCVPGRYQDETGQSSCKDAPAGTFVDGTAAPSPTDCPAGSLQALTGQTSCDAAPAGTFAAGPAATEAVDCSPGFFQPLTGQASCDPAPAGTFVAGTAATDTVDCSPGFFQDQPGQTSCDEAPAGTFVAGSAASETVDCSPGFFQPLAGQTSCDLAPAGTFVSGSMATETVDCSPGFFQDLTGQSNCNPAPIGTFVAGAAATDTNDCLPGTYQDETGQTSCKDAPAGTFVAGSAAPSPTDCPPGTFQALTGQNSCDDAPIGTFAAGPAATETVDCSPGFFQDQMGQSSCDPAPAGTFVAGSMATETVDCSPGSFQALTGQASCEEAPAGTFVAGSAAIEAVDCSPGFFQPLTGQTSCDEAPAGTFVAGSAATDTVDCSPGFFQDQTGQSSCNPAPAGTFVAGSMATETTDCSPGSFQDQTGQTSCNIAPIGTYVAGSQATEATSCPAEFTTLIEGATSINDCVPLEADLSITKSGSTSFLSTGNQITYTVTVSNAGPDPANNVVITDTLPAGTTLVSTVGCGEDPNGVPSCSLGTIPAGTGASITYVVDVTTLGAFTNTVEIASTTLDPDLSNNSATAEALACPIFPANVGTEDELNTAITCYNASPAGSYEINITADIVLVTDTVPIDNELGTTLTINGNSFFIDGDNKGRVFHIDSSTVNINWLTIQNGNALSSVSTSFADSLSGGGIFVGAFGPAALSISHSNILSNTAEFGGGIHSEGTVAIESSTVSGNQALIGAGILNSATGQLNVNSSTISNNISSNSGGGIAVESGIANIINSTISGNSAVNSSGGINVGDFVADVSIINSTIHNNSANSGSGVSNYEGSVTVVNTVISNNLIGDNCVNNLGLLTANLNNIASDNSCDNATASSNINLGPLQDNGGATFTHALLPGSDAIDAGDNAVCSAAPVNGIDQRGVSRSQGLSCDAGAFEYIADDWIFRNSSGSYVPGSNSQIQVNGTGTDWKAQFLRKDGSTFGSGNRVSFDFYVDAKDSKTYLSVLKEGGNYERFALADIGGNLKVNIYRPGETVPSFTQELLSSTEFQANTWYSASITIDDQYGSFITVEQRDDPSVSGSFRDTDGLLSTGNQWSFFGIMYQHSVFLDNYLEEAVTLTPPPADDWIFRNDSGGYVSGSESQIQVNGTGTNWKAQFLRKDESTFGSGNRVSFDFYVDQKNSKTYLSLVKDGGSFERFALVDAGGNLKVNIYRPGEAAPNFTQQLLSSTEFQANTWYSASITIDDQYGSFITVEQRDDPSVNGSFRDTDGLLSTGSQWSFFGIMFQHSVFLDNYLEEAVTLTPPPADDWTFRNDSGAYVPGSETQIQVNGTGTDWTAQFLRKDESTFGTGNQVSFDFYVDQKDSKTHLSVVKEGGSFERFALVDAGGTLRVNIYRPDEAVPNFTQQLLSSSEFQANTWYSASITIDDQYGSFIRVEQRDDPSISGSFRDTDGLLSTGNQWSFFGIMFQNSVFLDNYLEEAVTLTPPPADDWIFLNDSGGYVPGSQTQIQVNGTGTDWTTQFLRKGGNTFGTGNQVSFDFYVDQKDSKTHLSLVKEGGSFERLALVDAGGGLRANIYRPDEANPNVTQQILSAAQFQSNTWYSVTITVDDVNGSLIEVEQRDDPSVNGSFQDTAGLLSTGNQWSFFGIMFQHSVFIDNYAEGPALP